MPGSEADTDRVPQWLRRAAPTRLPSAQSDPPSDGWFKEWGECRALIGRLDTILSDLRKYGFTLVTGLFTASALVGGFSKTDLPARDRAVVFIGIMVLILVLFYVDTYYETLLNGAVERALDLEYAVEYAVRLTCYLSTNAARNGSRLATGIVYVGLLFTTGFVGFSVTGPGAVFDSSAWSAAQALLAQWFVVVAVLMLGYWIFAQAVTGGFTTKPRPSLNQRSEQPAPLGDA
jgi:hypothetical protein